MYIFDPGLEDQAVDTEIETILADIKDKGGEIILTEKLGRRQLAYDIKKKEDGIYFLAYFKAEGKALAPLKEKYRLDQNILRYMILRTREDRIQRPEEEEKEEGQEQEQAKLEKVTEE
jgi:small subunit ribosomal protein S6